jgi:hypothetical protein
MRRDFFACLNALVWVMRCRSLSNPAARALASSLVTAWAPSASAVRRNFTTSDSAARPFIRRIWPSGGRTERRGVANGALCPMPSGLRYSHVRDPLRGVLERGDEPGSPLRALLRHFLVSLLNEMHRWTNVFSLLNPKKNSTSFRGVYNKSSFGRIPTFHDRHVEGAV